MCRICSLYCFVGRLYVIRCRTIGYTYRLCECAFLTQFFLVYKRIWCNTKHLLRTPSELISFRRNCRRRRLRRRRSFFTSICCVNRVSSVGAHVISTFDALSSFIFQLKCARAVFHRIGCTYICNLLCGKMVRYIPIYLSIYLCLCLCYAYKI